MQITITGYDPADERRRELLFALGNGVLFVRASPPEVRAGDDHYYAGTYRAGCYDRRIVQFELQEHGHAALVNLPHWLPLTFRVKGEEEWFSLRKCEVLDYSQNLDMATGLVARHARFRDARGRRTRLREQRLVSMARPSVLALRLTLTPEDWRGEIELWSSIEGDVDNHNTDSHDLGSYRHLEMLPAAPQPGDSVLIEGSTRHSHIRLAVAAHLRADRPSPVCATLQEMSAVQKIVCRLGPDEPVTVEKIAAICTVLDPAAGDPGAAALAAVAEVRDFDELHEEHARSWRRLWDRVAIEADNRTLQQGLWFHAFHVLQTVSPHSAQLNTGFPARGLQEAYHGQIFWDEIFVFPFLNHRFPDVARSLLLYRYRRLPAARRAARASGYAGAMFPWRSADAGAEETPDFQFNPLTGRWTPDHTRLQRHIGAAIAHNVWHYYLATGGETFLAEYGAEMLVEIARFWASIARRAPQDDRYDINGVIGPDEYHTAYPGAPEPGLSNNSYTNIMATLTLRRAAAALDCLARDRREELVRALALTENEVAHWQVIASRLRLCFHKDGVLSQFEGFEVLKPFDGRAFTEKHPEGRVDWDLEAKGDTVNAYQVSKQADVLALLYLLQPNDLVAVIQSMGYEMDLDCLRRTASFYLGRMTHESSLSRIICAGALASLDPETSWSFFEAAICIDFDIANSAKAEEGLHLGAMAAGLDVLQRHYLGVHVQDDALTFAPALPKALGSTRLRLQYRKASLRVTSDGEYVRLESVASNPSAVTVLHGNRRHILEAGEVLRVRSSFS